MEINKDHLSISFYTHLDFNIITGKFYACSTDEYGGGIYEELTLDILNEIISELESSLVWLKAFRGDNHES